MKLWLSHYDNWESMFYFVIYSFQRLSSKITLTHESLPNNVRVVYTPVCEHAGPAAENEGVCDNVREGQKVSKEDLID